MPDIMMCDAVGCARATSCYRHADSGTKPSEWRQTYWLRADGDPIGFDCHNYWQRTPAVASAHDGSMP